MCVARAAASVAALPEHAPTASPTINTPHSSLDLARSEASEGGAELRHATLMNNGKDITDKEAVTIEQLWLSKQKTSFDEACSSCSG